MRKRFRLLLIALGLALAALLPAASTVLAHPMGNFSINHFASLQVGGGSLRILYIVDMAEIPTFQELSNIGGDPSGKLTPSQRESYLSTKVRDLASGLSLTAGGHRLPLQIEASDVLFPPGAGGLPTERLYAVLRAPARTGAAIVYHDSNFAGRSGWKEIVVAASSNSQITTSAARFDRSRDLTVYPTSVTSSPPQDLETTVRVLAPGTHLPGSAQGLVRQAEAPLLAPNGTWSPLARGLTRVGSYSTSSSTSGSAWSAGRIDVLSNLIKHGQLSVGLLLISLMVAFWFGAGHALSPGHGKTVVAAYLVGNRGTPWHAVLLGLTVTVTHTSGVFALGLVTLYLSHYIVPDQLYPWLGFASGLMVAGMGLILFVTRLRAWRARRAALPEGSQHEHSHDGGATHAHSHDHSHSYDHSHAHVHEAAHSRQDAATHRHGWFGKPHSHSPAGERDPLSLRSLVGLGISGGLLPCPSALVVLLSAIAFHRLAFGMLLIVAFSLGLATTLTSVGMAMVLGRRLVGRLRSGRLPMPALARVGSAIPLLSALVVAALGTAIAIGAVGPSMPVAL